MSSQLIDLSHQVEAGMVTYPGLPGPEISDYLSRAASHERYQGQAEFQIARIDMVAADLALFIEANLQAVVLQVKLCHRTYRVCNQF